MDAYNGILFSGILFGKTRAYKTQQVVLLYIIQILTTLFDSPENPSVSR